MINCVRSRSSITVRLNSLILLIMYIQYTYLQQHNRKVVFNAFDYDINLYCVHIYFQMKHILHNCYNYRVLKSNWLLYNWRREKEQEGVSIIESIRSLSPPKKVTGLSFFPKFIILLKALAPCHYAFPSSY